MTEPTGVRAPTTLSRRFVRYVLGFGVGVSIGLAPYLGKIGVPGFSSLLELYPIELKRELIPLSAFLLGIVAVTVQFYSAKTASGALLRRHFRTMLFTLIAGFLISVALYQQFVIAVPIEEGHHITVVIGWPRSPHCGCGTLDDLDCVRHLSVDPGAISGCWNNVHLVEFALVISYLFLLGGFGALVGLLLLSEESEKARLAKRNLILRSSDDIGEPQVLPQGKSAVPTGGGQSGPGTRPRS
jgi:hypothetical protein